MASETGRMSVSVAPEKQEKLDAIAHSLDRSRNWLVSMRPTQPYRIIFVLVLR